MARRVILALATVLAASVALGAEGKGIFSAPPKGKLPVPGEAARKEALRLVDEVYRADYEAARTPEARQALARKLLQAAAETGEPANRYVLLSDARDVAARAGGVDLSFEAADALAASYQVDALGMKFEALETAARAAGTAEQLKSVVEGALVLLDQAAARDDFDAGTRLGRFAVSTARRTHDPKLLRRVMVRNREMEAAARAYRKVKAALETLQKSPGDPEANLTVGHYLCLVKGDWETGLPMLALGSDESLKVLATKELEGVSDPAARAALGDGWWDLAQNEQGTARQRLQERARLWYAKALPDLAGLARAKVQKRLEELEPVVEAAGPQAHYLDAKHLKDVTFLTKLGQSWNNDARNLLQVRKTASGYTVGWTRQGGRDWYMVLFPKEDVYTRKLVASVSVTQGHLYVSLRSKELTPSGAAAVVPPGKSRRVEMWIEDGVAQVRIDGKPVPVDHNLREYYGYFAFIFHQTGVVCFHELSFESRKPAGADGRKP